MTDLLVCAGLDPSGGAGLIADVRVATALGLRPVGVITAQTVQNTTGTAAIHAVDAELVGNQLAFLLTDIEVRAVKIGLIGSLEVARAIADALQLTAAPVVLDPVLAPSLGEGHGVDGIAALRPHLSVITPNTRELAALTGLPVEHLAGALVAGRKLADQLAVTVLVKGGHLAGDEAIDLVIYGGHGGRVAELRGPRIVGGEHVHGTGCALSTAVACYLALGHEVDVACRLAKQYVAGRIAAAVRPGRGAAAVV